VKPCGTTLSCPLRFAGQDWQIDARGALYWPREAMLIVSDLHFEKSGFLAQSGAPIPRYDTRETLALLTGLIDHYAPRELLCLGDSFHDARAYARFHVEDRQALSSLIARVPHWHWVLGNHDACSSHMPEGEVHDTFLRHNILFAHEPELVPGPQIVGHFHPKLRLNVGGQRVSGPCFVHSETRLIMPALGRYTGGLDVRDAAIAGVVGSAAQHYLLYRKRIWKIAA